MLVAVLAGAYAVWGILAPRSPPVTLERPLSTAPGPEGYLALAQWLEQSGLSIHSLREPPQVLLERDGSFARPGHILITVMPYHIAPDRGEMNAMLDWVADGNTLVILAGLNDTPTWTTTASTTNFIEEFAYFTAIQATFRPDTAGSEAEGGDDAGEEGDARDDEGTDAAWPRSFVLTALPGHWLTEGVSQLAAVSQLPVGPWDLDPDAAAPAFSLARDPEVDVDALLITNFGEGAIVITTFASLWQNSIIGQRDNRRLVTNLVAHHLRPGASVIFDDFHHGLTTVYDARAFFADPRLATTLALLLGFWLLYAVFADSRLGQHEEPDAMTGNAAFVRVMGGLLARKSDPADAGLRLIANYLAHVHPYVEAGPEDTIWQRIAAISRLDPVLVESLRADHARLKAGRRVDLRILQRRLNAARRAFS